SPRTPTRHPPPRGRLPHQGDGRDQHRGAAHDAHDVAGVRRPTAPRVPTGRVETHRRRRRHRFRGGRTPGPVDVALTALHGVDHAAPTGSRRAPPSSASFVLTLAALLRHHSTTRHTR